MTGRTLLGSAAGQGLPVLGSVSSAVPVLLLISATRRCDASKLVSATRLVPAYRSDPLGKKKISTSVFDEK